MKRPVVLVIFAVIPLVAGCQRQAAQDTKFLISPGGGIGSVRIGMPLSDATSILGPPKTTRGGTGGETFYAWFDAADRNAHGLYVVAVADHVIRAGVHYDPEYVTPVGLRTGVNEGQIEAAMGEPSRVVSYGPQAHGLVYNNLGIGFTIIDGPKVRGYRTVAEIDVFGPQQWKWGRASPSMKGDEPGRIAAGAEPLSVGLRVVEVSVGPVLQLHEVIGTPGCPVLTNLSPAAPRPGAAGVLTPRETGRRPSDRRAAPGPRSGSLVRPADRRRGGPVLPAPSSPVEGAPWRG